MKKINFLPTKVKYNNYTKSIDMYYRKKDRHKLYFTKVPYEHYIFVDNSFRAQNQNLNEMYQLLGKKDLLLKNFMEPSDARELYNTGRYITAEADVSPEQRFMCDSFYNIEFPKNIKPRIYLLDIETYVTDSIMPSFEHNTSPINAITIYDTYTDKYFCWFCPKDEIDVVEETKKIKDLYAKYDSTEIEVVILNSYRDLLQSFMIFVTKNMPDIISAWNSKFDMPYIARKIFDEFGFEGLKFISPFNTVSYQVRTAIENGSNIDYDNVIPGIDVIDMLEMYKKHTPGDKPSFSLKNISIDELDESKLAFEDESTDPSIMYEKDFAFFCVYNIQDVRLIKMIEDKRKLLNLASIIRNISKIDYKDVFFESIIIDNLFFMEAIKRRETGDWNYVLPSKTKNAEKIKYLGGFVKQSLTGRYKWVADLDFRALYPSIDRTFNLSLETIVGKVEENHQEIMLYLLCKHYKTEDVNYVYKKLLPKYLEYQKSLEAVINSSDKKTISERIKDISIKVKLNLLYADDKEELEFKGLDCFVEWLNKNDYSFLPHGVIFDQKVKDAIVPKVFTDMSASRDSYKAIMKKHIENGNTAQAELYDVYQVAVKVINNAIYGVLASEKFRLFNINIAEGITSTGQMVIRNSQHLLNEYMNKTAGSTKKDFVLAIDTDSVIFTLGDLTDYPIDGRDPEELAKIADLSKGCQNYINSNIDSIIVKKVLNKTKATEKTNLLFIKNEWLGSAGLFVAKKAYAINMVFKEGFPYEILYYVGISLKRSSTPAKFKPFLSNILTEVLEFANKEEIDKLIIAECDRLEKEYTMQDIALPISINNIDGYTKNLPVHVRGARIWNKYFAKNNLEKIITEKVKYVYVERWAKKELNYKKEYVISVPNKQEHWDMLENEIFIDYDKMKARLIIKPVEKFYNAMGWKMSNLVTTNSNGMFNAFKTSNKSSSVKML